MDGSGSHEKISIRDSAKALKKYGSTSRHVSRIHSYVKHIIAATDTLQGIALKYGVTMEELRRINRLWASDSIFLRRHLMIPLPETSPSDSRACAPAAPLSDARLDDDEEERDKDADDPLSFLCKIDSAIASTKAEMKKTRRNSEFATGLYGERTKPTVPKVNNNSVAIVTSNGGRVQARLERQQDELFEL